MIGIIQRYSYNFFQSQYLPRKPRLMNQKKKALFYAIKQKQQEIIDSGRIDENLKQEPYIHKENYNFEMYLKYTKVLREQISKQNTQNVKTEKTIKKYDKPRYDLNIEDYYVWPSFHDPYPKPADHACVVACKIYASPKSLVHTFGRGMTPWRNKGASKEFDFEDSNLDKFLLYDYRQTTQYWGENKSDEFYANQGHIIPRYQKKKWPSYESFWESEEIVPFRVNCTRYGDFRKFKTWVGAEIAKCANLKSYEERVLEKYGVPEYFDQFDKTYPVQQEAPVFKYSREYFLEKGQKLDQSIALNEKLSPPEVLGEDYKMSGAQYQKLLREDLEKQNKQQPGQK